MAKEGNNECKCPNVKCERHGNCAACADHHNNKTNAPFCQR